MSSDERIRRRAYEIWEREGRPNGRDQEHWREAEAELAGAAPGVPRTGRVGRQKAAAAEGGATPQQTAKDEGGGETAAMTHAPRTGRVGQQKAAGMSGAGAAPAAPASPT